MSDSERKLSQISALGVIASVDGQLAVVDLGDGVMTPPIRWCVRAAGTVNEQRVPSIGEQVVLLNTCSGDCLSTMVIVGYLHCTAFPAPNVDVDTLTTDAGGFVSIIKTDGSESVTATERDITATSIKEKTSSTIHESGSHVIKSGSLTIDAPIIAKLTMAVKGAFSGAGGAFSKALSVAGIGFKSHTHKENNSDGGNTGGAQ